MRSHNPYNLLLIDIDWFKGINDTYGHAACDLVVVEVARRIGAAMNAKASCARWGGDEFIALLPEVSANVLKAAGYAVMAAINSEPVSVGEGTEIAVSASIGACMAEAGDPMEVAAEMADAALYLAKAQGRNMVVMFDADMQTNRSAQA